MNVFVFKNGRVELSVAEVLLIPEFKALLLRDVSPNKSKAFQEFTYLFFKCDPKSYPNSHGLNDEEKEEYAKDIAKLPKTYTPDELVDKAADKYIYLTTSVAQELKSELLRSLKISIKVVAKLRSITERELKKETLTDVQLLNLIDNQNKLDTLASSLPKRILALRESEKLVEDTGDIEKGRGGADIEDSQDPDKCLG